MLEAEEQDIEPALSCTQDQAGLVGEEGRNFVHLTEESSVEEDQILRPGACATPGDIATSLSFPSSEASSQDETDNVAAQPGALWIAQSAQLAGEAAEEQCRREHGQR